MPFLLLFIFPFAEFYAWYLFIDHYSFLDALLLMFFGGGFGLMIIRTQGQNVMMDMQRSFAVGKMPERYLIHRGMIILGGFLIMVPGILTKVLGTILILPGFRHFAVWFLKWYFLGKIAKGAFRVFSMGGMPGMGNYNQSERDVVEIQPKRIEDIKKQD